MKCGLREKCQNINACRKKNSKNVLRGSLEYVCWVTSLSPGEGFVGLEVLGLLEICSCCYTHSGSSLFQGSPGSKGPRGDRGEIGKTVSNISYVFEHLFFMQTCIICTFFYSNFTKLMKQCIALLQSYVSPPPPSDKANYTHLNSLILCIFFLKMI